MPLFLGHPPTRLRRSLLRASRVAACAMSPPQRISLRSTQPAFPANVRRGESDLLIDNAPFARFYHLTVNTPENKPLYDLAAVAEPAGAIALAMTESGSIAFLRHFRAIPATDPADHSAFTSPDPSRHGFTSLEIPRGFPKKGETSLMAAAREVREEVGVQVLRCEMLGWYNFNTAIVMTDIPIIACVVGNHVGTDRDEAESIEGVTWLQIDQLPELVTRGEIRCGMTLSAIAYLLAGREKIDAFLNGDVA